MRVLAISGDRSKRGVLYPGTPAFIRQEAYAKQFGNLDVVVFSRRSDGAKQIDTGALRIYPTNSVSRLFYGFDTIRMALRLSRPDVITVQDPFEIGLVAWLIATFRKVPLHVQIHTDFLSPEYARLSFVNYVRVLIAGFALQRASRIRVVSERIKVSLKAKYSLVTPITVLSVFADTERIRGTALDIELRSRFSKYKTRLLVISRLEPEKNVSLALRSFGEKTSQDSCLVIVGDGSQWRRLEMLARSLGISERVFFEGRKDAAPYYTIADLALVPSAYEGYGLVIVEALAAGKPVLSTDVGIAREAGAIIAPPEKFADALADWFKNGPRMGELKNYPYANFEEYVHAYCNDIVACTNGKKLP